MYASATLCVLTRGVLAWFLSGCISQTIDQEQAVMNKYIAIQKQSPAGGAAYVA